MNKEKALKIGVGVVVILGIAYLLNPKAFSVIPIVNQQIFYIFTINNQTPSNYVGVNTVQGTVLITSFYSFHGQIPTGQFVWLSVPNPNVTCTTQFNPYLFPSPFLSIPIYNGTITQRKVSNQYANSSLGVQPAYYCQYNIGTGTPPSNLSNIDATYYNMKIYPIMNGVVNLHPAATIQPIQTFSVTYGASTTGIFVGIPAPPPATTTSTTSYTTTTTVATSTICGQFGCTAPTTSIGQGTSTTTISTTSTSTTTICPQNTACGATVQYPISSWLENNGWFAEDSPITDFLEGFGL